MLSGIYTFADMLLNGEPIEASDGNGTTAESLKSHMELCDIAAAWGSPWHQDATAGNGYPILEWQYQRGDYRDICGFDPASDPTGIVSTQNAKSSIQNEIYNLSGQRIQKMQRGINIVGGKKIIAR